MTASRLLCLSYTKLMQALVLGEVNAGDLGNALFCFACSREGFQSDDAPLRRMYPNQYEQVAAAVAAAEQEGRIRWRPRADGDANYGLVNELLVTNGYGPIAMDGQYHPAEVAKRLPEKSNLRVLAPGGGRLVVRSA